MVALCVVGYVVVGLLVARHQWIQECRRHSHNKNVPPEYGNCDDYCRTYPRGCNKCYHLKDDHGPSVKYPMLVGAFWPICIAIYTVVSVVYYTVVYSFKAIQVAVRYMRFADAWTWFWQDPKERKLTHDMD